MVANEYFRRVPYFDRCVVCFQSRPLYCSALLALFALHYVLFCRCRRLQRDLQKMGNLVDQLQAHPALERAPRQEPGPTQLGEHN